MLEENNPATGLQNSSNTANSLGNAGNRAQRKRATHRIDCGVGQRNAFLRKIQKFDIELGLASLRFCQTNHSPGWVRAHRSCLLLRDCSGQSSRQGRHRFRGLSLRPKERSARECRGTASDHPALSRYEGKCGPCRRTWLSHFRIARLRCPPEYRKRGFRSVLAVSSFRFRARLDVSIPSAFSGQRGC